MCWIKKGAFGPLGSKMSYDTPRTRLFETLLLVYRSGGCSRGPRGGLLVPKCLESAIWQVELRPRCPYGFSS